MTRQEEVLKLLKKRGQKGVSAVEIAEQFGFVHSGSSSKIIGQLRQAGHDIIHDNEASVYILRAETTSKDTDFIEKGHNPETEHFKEYVQEEDVPDDDNLFHKLASKKDKILEYLIRAGKAGGDPSELSKYSGVGSKNVCFHIHALRKEGHKILTKEGRYFIRKNSRNPNYNIGTQDLPLSEIPVGLMDLLGDKRLVNDIHKLRREELPVYIDFLRKIIFYTKCALAMYETREMLETLSIGDGQ